MQLPNLGQAWVEEKKIVSYLLNTEHPEGGGKAKYFLARGFVPEHWKVFEKALLVHADTNPVATVRKSTKGYGDLYQVDCTLAMPDGSQACIRSVWDSRRRPASEAGNGAPERIEKRRPGFPGRHSLSERR